MISRIKNWLLKPYPLTTSNKIKLSVSFSIGAFVFFFLLIFKPFGFNLFTQGEMLYYSYLYAIITILTILFSFFVLPIIFDSFFEPSEWRIYKEILFEVEVILIIGVSNWFFADYSTHFNPNSEYGILFFIGTAFLIGFFPTLILIFFIERRSYTKKQKIAKKISSLKTENIQNSEAQFVTIVGENKKEKISFPSEQLLYISSEKNYASIFYLDNEKVKEKLIRNSLNKIEKQLKDFPSIIRCHKSYIVNSNHVEKIEGNARNYLLKLTELDFLIPVSRKFPRELLFTLLKK